MVEEDILTNSSAENESDALSLNIKPQSGYFDCSFREFALYDKKTSQMFSGPASDPGTVRRFQNKLDFNERGSPQNVNEQMTNNIDLNYISGARSAPGEGHYTIEKGFVVSSTGAAYWVERSSEISFLVRGTFQGDGSFFGEWLSSDGARGSYDLEPQNRSPQPQSTPQNVTVAAIGVPIV